MNLKYVVTNVDDNTTIAHILRKRLKISSRLLNKLKMNEKILVNNIPVFSNYIVHTSDNILVKIDFEEIDNIIPQNLPIEVLYEDDYLLAVNKPAGIVVHPSSYHPDNTLANRVKYYLNNNKKIRAINRLDRDTSGIVLFAKNEYIQELMIQDKNIQKEYLAIVKGTLKEKQGTISEKIARKQGSIMEREINNVNGQTAITHYNLIKEMKIKNEDYSLLELKLETGRTHQIRVHLKYIGNPILGDSLYDTKSELINRQALHAYKLTCSHPINKSHIEIVAPMPNDMNEII